LAARDVWPPEGLVCNKNRDVIFNAALKITFQKLLLAAAQINPMVSSEHCSVNNTLEPVWNSHRSRKPVDAKRTSCHSPSWSRLGRRPMAIASKPRETSAACCSPTRPTASQAMERPGCSKNCWHRTFLSVVALASSRTARSGGGQSSHPGHS